MLVTINYSPIQDYAHPDDHEKKILKTLDGSVREREKYLDAPSSS